jgi:hypothetical protein
VAALLLAGLLVPGEGVRVMLDRPVYAPGLSGHVQVQIGRDGYLLVLHADPEGRVRVAFPLDPDGPNRVRAGDRVDITGRHGRPAFTIEDTVGTGKWYAAISDVPFQGDSFVRGDHWDYRRFPTLGPGGDWDGELTDLVSRLARGPFDHDIATYRVVPVPTASRAPPSREGPADPYAVPRYPGVRLDAKVNTDSRGVP